MAFLKTENAVHRLLRRLRRAELGGAMLEFAVIIPILLILAVGVVDFGRGFYTGITVANAARTGAQYGTQDVLHSTYDSAMIAAARDDANDQTLVVTPTHYCRCPDGTDPGCAGTCAGYGDPQVYVQVAVAKTFRFLFKYPGLPDSLVFRDSTTLRAY